MSNQKVWFITGASRGFGLDIASAVLAAGDKVVATVRSNPDQLKQKLNNNNNLEVVVLDVTRENEVAAGVTQAIAKFGQIDVLVNNAGYGFLGAIEEASSEEIKKQYDTNVFGLLNVTKAVLPHMRTKQRGHIINVSSLFGYKATLPGFAIYSSTKFAVEGISEGLALEVAAFGIHVTAVAPGLFSTDFLAHDSFVQGKKQLEAYEGSVGGLRNVASQLHGNQPGDPAKLAQVIIQLANSEHPPVHLPIGKDSVAQFRDKLVTTGKKEVTAWEAVSNSTDHVRN